MSRKSPKAQLYTLLSGLCALGFLAFAVIFALRWKEYHCAKRLYANLMGQTVSAAQFAKEDVPIQVDFARLQQQNPDIIGWLYCAQTNINYPILQGENNNTYLRRLPDGTRNQAGSLFLDERCTKDMQGRNLIIYGHRMNDETMFGQLKYYAQQEFFASHPTMYLLTPEQNYRVELFSAYTAQADGPSYQVEFTDDVDWANYQQQITEQSVIDPPQRPKPDQRIVTLSTCSYDFQNARFLVHGILEQLQKEA